MNLYGPPQSNQDFIDNQLSIDVRVLVHSSVGVVCACVFVYVCVQESEPLNVSVLPGCTAAFMQQLFA